MAEPTPTGQVITRAQLLRSLDRQRRAGALSREQIAGVLGELDRTRAREAAEGAAAGDRAPSRRPAVGAGRLAEAAAYAGAVLVAASGVLLVAQNWEGLSRPGRATVLAGVTVVLAVVGAVPALRRPRGRAALLQPAHSARRRLVGTVLTAAAATAGGTAGLLVPSWELLVGSLVAWVAVLGVHRAAPTALGEAAALGATLLVAGAILERTGAAMTAVVLTMAALGAGWSLLPLTRLVTVPLLARVLGLYVVWNAGVAGTFSEEQPATAVGITLLSLLALASLGSYVRSPQWPFALAGAASLAALVLRISSDSLGPVVAVLVTGLLLLGVSAVLVLRRGPGAPPRGNGPALGLRAPRPGH